MAPSEQEGRLMIARVILSFTAAISYFISFGQPHLLKDAKGNTWGSWEYCDYSNNTKAITVCELIAAGESPDYFEAHRVFAAFACVAYIFTFLTWNPTEGLGKGYRPALLSICIVIEVLISLTALATGVKDVTADDDFFKASVELDWCFHLACFAGGMTLITIPIMLLLVRQRAKLTKAAPAAPKPKASTIMLRKPKPTPSPWFKPEPKPESKPPGVDDTKLSSVVVLPAISSDTPSGDVKHGGSRPSSSDVGPAPGGDRTGAGAAEKVEERKHVPLPVLNLAPLPNYDMPELMEGGHPVAPPLDYTHVIGNDDAAAPVPVVVPRTRLSKLSRYVYNYARVSVGMKKS